jgi:hypothetical protein
VSAVLRTCGRALRGCADLLDPAGAEAGFDEGLRAARHLVQAAKLLQLTFDDAVETIDQLGVNVRQARADGRAV